MDHMWSAGKAVEIGLQCWGNWKISVKLTATQHKCSVIALKLDKVVKVA